MNYFNNDKFFGLKTREEQRCKCGAQPDLVRKIMDPVRGLTVRMFECRCGERSGPRIKSKVASVGDLPQSLEGPLRKQVATMGIKVTPLIRECPLGGRSDPALREGWGRFFGTCDRDLTKARLALPPCCSCACRAVSSN
jgi:hypothetical protein